MKGTENTNLLYPVLTDNVCCIATRFCSLKTAQNSFSWLAKAWLTPPRLRNQIYRDYYQHRLPMWHSGKESACQCRRLRRHGFDPWIKKIPWRRKWQPIPVFLPGKFHGQSLAGYSPQGHKASDTTEHQHRPGSGCLLNIISPQWGRVILKDTVQEKKKKKKPSSN